MLFNAFILFSQFILPPARYSIAPNEKAVEMYSEEEQYSQGIHYSDNFAYIYSLSRNQVEKIDLDSGELVFTYNLTEFNLTLGLPFLDPVVDVDDNGIYVLSTILNRVNGSIIETPYFNYIVKDKTIYSEQISDSGNWDLSSTSRTIRFKDSNLLFYVQSQPPCEFLVFRYDTNGFSERLYQNQLSPVGDRKDLGGTVCEQLDSVYNYDGDVLFTLYNPISDGSSTYQFNIKERNYRLFKGYTEFIEKRDEIFQNQSNTYKYHGMFEMDHELVILAVWNDRSINLNPDIIPERYLDILTLDHHILFRFNWNNYLSENIRSGSSISGSYRFIANSGHLNPFNPLNSYHLGQTSYLLAFTQIYHNSTMNLLYLNKANSSLSTQEISLTNSGLPTSIIDFKVRNSRELLYFTISFISDNNYSYSLLKNKINGLNFSAKYELIEKWKKYLLINIVGLLLLLPLYVRIRKHQTGELYPKKQD